MRILFLISVLVSLTFIIFKTVPQVSALKNLYVVQNSQVFDDEIEVHGVLSSGSAGVKKATPSVKPTPRPGDPVAFAPQVSGKSIVLPIITYHYIGNNPNPADTARDNLSVTPDKFEVQMEYLSKNGYNTVSLDTMYSYLQSQSVPAKTIVLTFDDGYIDFYLNAFPILQKYHLHAVQFIPTGLIGQPSYMTWSQIKEIDASGLVSFQAHSVTHPNLTGLSVDQLNYEISESKTMLQNALGKPVNFFAYPYGLSNQMTWEGVKKAGFIGAVGTYSGKVLSEGAIFNLPRVKIGNYDAVTFASVL